MNRKKIELPIDFVNDDDGGGGVDELKTNSDDCLVRLWVVVHPHF